MAIEAPVAPTDQAVLELDIAGMTCSACAATIERKLGKLDGVRATVNFATERALVSGLGADAETAIRAVEKAGYRAAVHVTGDDEWTRRAADTRTSSLRRRLTVAALLTVPLSDLTILLALVPAMRFPGWQLWSVALALPIITWAAWPFHRATWRGLRRGTLSMDTLVSLGSSVAFLWAIWSLLVAPSTEPGYWLGFGRTPAGADALYLDVAAGMVTFQLAGRYFESRARGRAGDVLNALANLAVSEVTLLDAGVERRAAVAELRVGGDFVVRPGERIAADGAVLEGRSTIDTSSMTGEPVPVEAEPGSTVIGGTVNGAGRLVVRAERVGAHTRLAQLAALAEEAQRRKAGVTRFVDRVSAVFIPAVIVIAVVVTAGWLLAGATVTLAVGTGIAVLIIACPCALGLATPTALMVGVGRGSQLGLLVKGQDALEASGRIDTVVLDKTGTLTTGAMRVDRVVVAPGADDSAEAALRDAALRDACALEAGSEHAIGRAIVTAAARFGRPEPVRGFQALPGLGAEGEVRGRALFAGNARLAADRGVPLADWATEAAASAERVGGTAVFLMAAQACEAVFVLADEVKPSAAAAVRGLRALGLRTVLLTGDSDAAAAAVAEALGIDEAIAGVLPDEKAARIAALQQAGHRVAMVGDGINDSAALATAELGMAMVTGTDVAMKAADVILVRDDLRVIVDAVALSRRTLGTIRGNLVWAFGYNIAAIPIAASGLLNPLIAAAAMALSSVFVVTNSLRLARFQPYA